MINIPLQIDQISEGYIILGTGLFIVFSSLVLLSVFFKFGVPALLNSYKAIKKGKEKGSQMIKKDAPAVVPAVSEKEFTGETAAAIATALHMYLHEQHDNENAILTIKQAKKMYSPWSSKIYATHQNFR
ncbi:hypothetical protein EGM88_01850 [Aureibaculum marinum]|uniref:Oxaloacetate decarboxylase gamma chain n=1 Tax=Aureibaculum marinum TaxID=2487930 RepID=A0A3N4P0R1_9FLAO|nr:OadG family protein [Aureibaculum marinum]RPE00029.1 hypothetical protein EGM88_01850 [Aureibaculum marinum]